MNYLLLGDKIGRKSNNAFASTTLSYRINKGGQLKVKAKKSNNSSSLIGAKYVENFGKSLKIFLSAEQNIDEAGSLENKYGFGFSFTIGGESQKEELPPLFKPLNPSQNLKLDDLEPIEEVNQDKLETFSE